MLTEPTTMTALAYCPLSSPRSLRSTARFVLLAIAASVMISLPTTVWAEGEGQADLDEAMVKRIDAKSASDLQQVSTLLESALAKGLDDENQAFAKKMLGAVSLQKGRAYAEQIKRTGARGFRELRREAIEALETAVKHDPTLAEAHLLIARLNVLPGGDQERARKAATAAIQQLGDDDRQRSEALVLRALLQTDNDARMEDFDRAIKADPESVPAHQGRAMLRMQTGDTEAALEDMKKLMELTPENSAVVAEAVRALLRLERTEDAEKLLSDALSDQPRGELYRLRAVIYQSQEKNDNALDDLAKALTLDERDFAALLMRAEILLGRDDVKGARRDVNKAMQIEPNSVQGILMRSMLAYEEGRMADAINDMQLLVNSVPDNEGFALQLANFYQLDKRPRKAIAVISKLLARDAENWRALRLRGDAQLSTVEHAKAIADYESALEIINKEEDQSDLAISKSGILNNLAWVLATSTDPELRDGDRALKYGMEASELTEFKEAHILSTLAAAYAETGDFEKAIEWSTKAVELGEQEQNEQLDQLKKELENYKQNKPWREEQAVEENTVPILSPEDIIDT
ncbi:tetratricopeptide repeat protein [Roseimaritima ulvae]|uniref:Tetratricopeptide repeat protein n=2 Tax=Roseimaritima ulvae TaxID=980254 RepID=A0A5B9QRY5_9BACT|nr:tetratricopeptide repeat protein [Roseimaritima ulvae]